MTLDPAVAAVRLAVRRGLADVGDHTLVVACSGGADSLALLAATVFEARDRPWRVVGATVDHGLQQQSAEHAERVVAQMVALGVDETATARVTVDPGGRGVEAAAREARYAVLDRLADSFGSSVVLLGHTLDDQAETVLLGLTRGSGGRSIAGMRPGFERIRRPLLGVRRSQTEQACRAQGIEWWEDPHNADPRFTRARIRHRVLPVLEEELGPGVSETLARTGELLRADMVALDDLAEATYAAVRDPAGLRTPHLEVQPWAILTRVVRLAALDAGAAASELTRGHIEAMAGLVHGHARHHTGKQIQLPGHLTAYRDGDHLRFRRTTVES